MAHGTSPLTSSRAAASVCLRSLPHVGICEGCVCSPCQTIKGVRLKPAQRLQNGSYLTKTLCRAGPPQVLLTYRALLFCYCLGLGISQTLTRGVWVFAYYTMWCALAGGPSAQGPASSTHAAASHLLMLLHPRQCSDSLQTWSGRGSTGRCAPAASRAGLRSRRCWWALVAYFGLATLASLRAAGQERLVLRGAPLDRLGYAVVVLFHLILPVRACRPPAPRWVCRAAIISQCSGG